MKLILAGKTRNYGTRYTMLWIFRLESLSIHIERIIIDGHNIIIKSYMINGSPHSNNQAEIATGSMMMDLYQCYSEEAIFLSLQQQQ